MGRQYVDPSAVKRQNKTAQAGEHRYWSQSVMLYDIACGKCFAARKMAAAK